MNDMKKIQECLGPELDEMNAIIQSDDGRHSHPLPEDKGEADTPYSGHTEREDVRQREPRGSVGRCGS